MAEARTWQESVLQVFHELISHEFGNKWKKFLSEQGFHFDWSVINASGVSWAAEAKKAFAPSHKVDRSLSAFSDMPSEVKWIFPGRLAQSALYHLLASADAVPDLLPTPTQKQIETVENAVYAAQNFKLDDIYGYAAKLLPNSKNDADSKPILSVVVFACEYRSSPNTPHGLHADMCYARTGVARVGTIGLPYNEELRSYPFTDTKTHDPFQIPVLPARYAAYLAVSCPGSSYFLGNYVQPGDDGRNFWVPVHKLFPGENCLMGLKIELEFHARHVNEKLRRFHLYMQSQHINTNWDVPDIDAYPFTFTHGIAYLGSDFGLGSQEVVPVPHNLLVEPAMYRGAPLTYWVPPFTEGVIETSSSSLYIQPTVMPTFEKECHPSPEILNARHEITNGSKSVNLNEKKNVITRVRQGRYQAQHFLDFTGDGWVEARPLFIDKRDPLSIPPLSCLAAYSLVAAPDFLPKAGQRAVKDLFQTLVPVKLQGNFWNEPPDSLADQRDAPNLTLNEPRLTASHLGARFDPQEDTITAVVTLPFLPVPARLWKGRPVDRRSCLPDTAAGVFAPGWDVGLDINEDKVFHLAMYSLGSPFVTDSKICCALSAFWPTASPDTARKYEPNVRNLSPTIVPLTDSEIGMTSGIPSWDGIAGPRLTSPQTVQYHMSAYADYVEPFLDSPPRSPFYLKEVTEITSEEYIRRLLAMFRVYKALDVPVDRPLSSDDLTNLKAEWAVLSFQRLSRDPTDPNAIFNKAQMCLPEDLQPTLKGLPKRLKGLFFSNEHPVYFFDMYRWDSKTDFVLDKRYATVTIKEEKGMPIRRHLFVGDKRVIIFYAAAWEWQVAPPVAGL